MTQHFSLKLLSELRDLAVALPDVEAGVACEGTALEKHTLKVRGRAFLFLGSADLMLKLHDSLPDAEAVAAKHPLQVKAGATGWVTVKFDSARPPVSKSVLTSWVRESYELFAAAPKKRGKK